MDKEVSLFLLIIIFSSLPVFFTSPTSAPLKTNSSNNAIKHVAIVFSTGGLGDKSYNDAAFSGAQRANDTSLVQIDYAVPTTINEINQYIEAYASQTSPYAYDLIIVVGYSAAAGVNASSIKHPSINFAIIDDNSINRSNVADITFKEHEGSFLVGAMAAMTTQSKIIGFLGGQNISLINKFRSGYEQGTRYVDPNITILVSYSPDQNNPYGNITAGQLVANAQISLGADIIYAAAGGTCIGVFNAVNASDAQGSHVYAIGVDSDQDYIYPGNILTSMVKRVDTATYDLISTTINSTLSTTFMGKDVILGLAENGVGMTNMTYTNNIRNSLCNPGVTRFGVDINLKEQIISGSIVVSNTIQIQAQYNTVPHMCSLNIDGTPVSTTSTTTTTNSTTTSSTNLTSTISTTPGFTLVVLLAVVIIYIRRKNKF